MLMNCIFIYLMAIKISNMQIYYFLMPSIDTKGFNGHYFLEWPLQNANSWALKHHKTKINGPLFLLMVINNTEGVN